MQSIRLATKHYDGYEANPSRSKEQEQQRRSADSDEQTLRGDDEERESKEQEIETKRKESDPHYVTWDGEDDKLNPRNWSYAKKWSILILVTVLTFFVTFSSSVFSADSEVVSELFGISEEVAELGTALYLVGFGLGPLWTGPMSEAFGRSPVYFFTFFAFLLCNLGPALGQNPQAIFISRFFTGFFGSTPLSNAGGSVNDMFDPLDRTLAFPVFASMPFLGPVMGPLVAGACTVAGTSHLNPIVDWRWIYWFTIIFGGAYLVLMFFLLPETEASAVLSLKARAIRKQTGDKNYYCDMDKRPEPAWKLIVTAFPKPIILLFTEPIIMALSIYLLVIYAILYMDFEGYSLLFSNETYKFNLVQVGLAFLAIGVGIFLTGATAPLQWWDYRPFYKKALADGQPMASPEYRLRPLLIGGFLVPIGVFWLAWTARPGVPWPAPVLAGIPFGAGLLFVFLQVYQYLIDCYGPLAATALASATLFRYVGAGGLVMVVMPMYENLSYTVDGQAVYAWPLSLLGFLSIACLPIPFALYFGGGNWLRQRSPRCVKF